MIPWADIYRHFAREHGWPPQTTRALTLAQAERMMNVGPTYKTARTVRETLEMRGIPHAR